jgi:hypothetical protein
MENHKLTFMESYQIDISYYFPKTNIENLNEELTSTIVYPVKARYFIIKSTDEDNIHKSIKYKIWSSTEKGNLKLHKAFIDSQRTFPIYLFFSVNGSGRFIGAAQMISEYNNAAIFNYWSQSEKWKGYFHLAWLDIKDIPNRMFKHLYNVYNDNKPVIYSRDTQEIHPMIGSQMLKIFHEYESVTSIVDDFEFYENRQEFNNTKMKNKNENFNQFYNIEYNYIRLKPEIGNKFN